MWVSTFHSMCVRILRRNIDRIGYSKNFSILDTSDQLTVIKKILKEQNIDPKKYDPRSMLNAISSAKNNALMLNMYRAQMNEHNPFEKTVAEVYTGISKNALEKINLSTLMI